MPFKHIEDRRAYGRRYYQEHLETMRAQSRAWAHARMQDPEYRRKLNDYRRARYLRKTHGL